MTVSDNYRADIDGLRAISILMVVFHHAVPEAKSGGFIGVDVFFVISGFLITSLLLKEIASGSINYLKFFWRRFCRLMPALFLVLTVVLTVGYFILFPDEFASLSKQALAGLFFVSNILQWTESGYFDQSAYTKPLLHLWSLGIEEQFYILWPFFLAFCALSRKILVATFVIVAISFSINLTLTTIDSNSAFFLPFGRLWELGAGALLAICQNSTRPKSVWMTKLSNWQNLAACAGLTLIMTGFFVIKPSPNFPGWEVLLPVIGTVLLLQSEGSWLNRLVLAHKALVFLGLISYALYLWHWPLISFIQIIWGTETPPLYLRALAVTAAVVLASTTYQWVEKPSRQVREPNLYRLIAWLSPLAILTLVSASIYVSGGMPNRPAQVAYQENHSQLKRLEEDPVDAHTLCKQTLGLEFELRYCNVNGTNPSVALIGDSHARVAYEAVAAELKKHGLDTANLGGRLFLGINTFLIGSQFEFVNNVGSIQATQAVIDSPTLEHVVMFAFGPPYISGRKDHVFESTLNPHLTNPDDIWEAGIRHTFDRLLEAGKDVTFVLNNPELDFDPRDCLTRPYASALISLHSCEISIETFHHQNDHYRQLMWAIIEDYPTVKVFDLASELCDGRSCSAMRDGKLLYRDDNHLSPAGGQLIAPNLINVILEK